MGQVVLDEEWIADHFDYLSRDLAQNLHPALATARHKCPIARSDQYGGFFVASRYEDVLRIAQDWETWSSELGISIPKMDTGSKLYPIMIDPPLQRTFKRLINAYFTPKAVAPWEAPTRALVNRLIDGFIADGRTEFMEAFARPFPGLAFFDLALHAPAEDVAPLTKLATDSSLPNSDKQMDALRSLIRWIAKFVETRRQAEPIGDVVDGILAAEVDGRPITDREVVGTIQTLIAGGLETTAGVLGMAMQRFCANPELPKRLHDHPDMVPAAIEELLRLDGSLLCMARTARVDTELGGKPVKAGEQVLIYWASANRDEGEFDNPDEFIIDRPRNRHIAFGAGTHRCAGSNLARMNLRVAIEEVTRRMGDFQLDLPAGEVIEYHSAFNRVPEAVPITFRAL